MSNLHQQKKIRTKGPKKKRLSKKLLKPNILLKRVITITMQTATDYYNTPDIL